MTRLIVYVDPAGVEKVELEHATPEERERVHKMFIALRHEIERLDAVVKAAGVVGDEQRQRKR
jgi:hypothetical protein